jgi:hypothetical protein
MSEAGGSSQNEKAQAKADKAFKKASRPWFKKKRFWVIGLIGISALSSSLGGGGSDSSSSSSTSSTSEPAEVVAEEPATKITAKKLIDDLESNALSAKTNYKDKRFEITGILSNIDASGKYFSLSAGEFTLTSVQVFIDKKFVETVSGFTKGQSVTVTGKVTDVGELLGYQVEAESIP